MLWEECGIPAFLQYRIVSTSHDYSKGSKQFLVLVVKPMLYFIIQLERVFSFSVESSRSAPCKVVFTAGSSEWDSAFGTAWDGVSWFYHLQSPSWLEFAEQSFPPCWEVCAGLQEGEADLLCRSCRTELFRTEFLISWLLKVFSSPVSRFTGCKVLLAPPLQLWNCSSTRATGESLEFGNIFCLSLYL